MPQAMLPDLNTAYIKYRNLAITNLDSKNYGLCTTALYSINALLPEDYKIKISTDDYKAKTELKPLYSCQKCSGESQSVQVFEKLTPMLISVISDEPVMEYWTCETCGLDNSLSCTEVSRQVLDEPTFLHMVPAPPQRQEGLMDRTSFHIAYSRWAETFLIELEERMGKFRTDYREQNKDQDDIDFGDTDYEGEEESS